MTERGRNALQRDPANLEIGQSKLTWAGDSLKIDFDEWSFPIPGRVKGTVYVDLDATTDRVFALDAQRKHQWWPIAPHARIRVALDTPSLDWHGSGYFDANRGTEPLESAFQNWTWSRATIGDESFVLYDITRRDRSRVALALQIDRDGQVGATELPETVALPPTSIWRIPRATQSEGEADVLRTFEDTPFYSRSQIRTRLLGQETQAMHESLALSRLRSPIVKSLLPWRMPRAAWPV
ncbi:MAG: hydratase [Pseudomonadota bacterium]